jgi:hypothetical protein
MKTIMLHYALRFTLALSFLTLFVPGKTWAQALLENPQPLSFQSGIGFVTGWVCNASRVDIEFDNGDTLQAAYGTSREDTRAACGDANNGFGLLFNWNILGDGERRVRALADGVPFAEVTFTVATLGLGEFAGGLSGSAQVGDFPEIGTGMRVQWQESQQNFPLAGAFPPGVDAANQCTTLQGPAVDGAGGQALTTWTNPCLLAGNAILGRSKRSQVQHPRRREQYEANRQKGSFCAERI